jgi:hypothetical protein
MPRKPGRSGPFRTAAAQARKAEDQDGPTKSTVRLSVALASCSIDINQGCTSSRFALDVGRPTMKSAIFRTLSGWKCSDSAGSLSLLFPELWAGADMPSYGQNARDMVNVFGAIMQSAIVQTTQAEWRKLGPRTNLALMRHFDSAASIFKRSLAMALRLPTIAWRRYRRKLPAASGCAAVQQYQTPAYDGCASARRAPPRTTIQISRR